MSDISNNTCLSGDEVIKHSEEFYAKKISELPTTNKSVEEIEKIFCLNIEEGVEEGFNYFNFVLNFPIKSEDLHELKDKFIERGFDFTHNFVDSMMVISLRPLELKNGYRNVTKQIKL